MMSPRSLYDLSEIQESVAFDDIEALELCFQPSDSLLSTLEDLLGKLSSLRKLDLTGCDLKRLPGSLRACSSLEILELGGNAFPVDELELLDGLPRLRHLGLQRLGFETWPAKLNDLTIRLEVLELSGNSLRTFPRGLACSEKLRELHLYGHAFEDMPAKVHWPRLEVLSLGSPRKALKALPEIFAEVPLQSLRVWGALESLPQSLANHPSLSDLDVRENPLDDRIWPIVTSIMGLQELNLTGTQVTRVPGSIQALATLRHLALSRSPVRELAPELWSLSSLVSLNFNDCKIEELAEPTTPLPALGELLLARNALKRLPENLGAFSALKMVDFEGNGISALPESILSWTSLRELVLTGNCLEEEALEVLGRLREQTYKRDPFAVIHQPRRLVSRALCEGLDKRPLSAEVKSAVEALGACFREADENEISEWPTAGGPWVLSLAARELLFRIDWRHRYFDLALEGHDIWSVDFSKGRPLEDFECSYKRPFICLGEYHGGNELLLISLDDSNPGDPELFHLDHEESYELEPIRLGLCLSSFLSNLSKA